MNAILLSRFQTLFLAALLLGVPYSAIANECVLSINQPVVDFGESKRAQLLQGARDRQYLFVGKRVISLNVSCPTKTAIALTFNGSRADDQGYRFAQDGMFTMNILSAQLDGKPISLMSRDAPMKEGGSPNQLRPGISLVPSELGHISRGETFSAQVEVKSYVHERDTQARSQEQWSGEGHFAIDTF